MNFCAKRYLRPSGPRNLTFTHPPSEILAIFRVGIRTRDGAYVSPETRTNLCAEKAGSPCHVCCSLTSFFLTSFGPKSVLFTEKVPPYVTCENVGKVCKLGLVSTGELSESGQRIMCFNQHTSLQRQMCNTRFG